MEGGPWGLVIILAAFMIQFLAFGATATIGVYNIELLEYFPGSTIGVSLIASLNFGIFLGSGPIVSFLMTKFSYRKIALFGSTLVVLGLLGMPLLPYIPTMCLCFGLLTGFGSCCAYIPSHVLSGLYYDKNRSLATGVATSGSGLGGAVMPVVAGLLIEQYSWKGSFVVVAGLCLHMFIFSSLLLMPSEAASPEKQEVSSDPSNGAASPKSADHEKLVGTEDLKSLGLGLNSNGVGGELKPLISETAKGIAPPSNSKPLVSEQSGDEAAAEVKSAELNKGQLSDPKPVQSEVSSGTPTAHEMGSCDPSEAKALLLSQATSRMNGSSPRHTAPSGHSPKPQIVKSLTALHTKAESSSLDDVSVRARSRTVCLSSEAEPASQHVPLTTKGVSKPPHHHTHPWRLSSSLTSLHTVGTTRGSCYLVLDKLEGLPPTGETHSPFKDSEEEEEEEESSRDSRGKLGKERKKPKSSRHIYIFMHYGFNIYFFSNILWNAGCSIVSSFAPEYLRSQGLSAMEAAWLMGAFGFGCFVGGILGGLLGNASWVNRQALYTLANFVMGAALTVFPLVGGRAHYLVCLLVSGLAFGIILGLLIVVLTDLIGVESLGNGLGYLMLSNGMGTFMGPPLAGCLKEATGGFESGIILAGALCIGGGLVMLLMPCKDLATRHCLRVGSGQKGQDEGGVAMVTGV